MAASPNPPKIARFAVFEVDVTAGELRKSGAKVRLQEQPFQLLLVLLENAGTLLSREELRQKLWAEDTFVDFDHSLNTAVNKIREALKDSAASPRYIETVARKGYRFVAPVEWAGSPTEPKVHTDLDIPQPNRTPVRLLFSAIQIMYLVFYLCALFLLSSIDRLGESFLGRHGWIITILVLVTAGAGIPLRCYLLSAVAFDYRRLGEKFRRLFLPILILDQLWATAPFLLANKIGFGAAFAATALLLYVPFSERTLLRMAYPVLGSDHGQPGHAT
ncbi:MAG TPA: winged helix-turn-helix domain-containing protein [Terriglobales bacterium]|nr:winged helix-turn-helix domain-containing protein [Terriglobales bacterium]